MGIIYGSVGVIRISETGGVGGIKISISRIGGIDEIKEVLLIRWENVRRTIVDIERICDVGVV